MVVFGDIFFDLSVGDFRGTLVEQLGACHDDSALKIYFDEFANVSRSFLMILAILASLWATALAAWRKDWSWLPGELGSLLRISLRVFGWLVS